MNFKTEVWPIGRFIHYARNPRKNDAQVDRMVASIKEFGFRIPVVAKSDGSVVDGHLRLKAAVALGMTEVPVALADELTDAQVKAFRLLANKSANWAEWDIDLLVVELDDLLRVGVGPESAGFSEPEAEEIRTLASMTLSVGASSEIVGEGLGAGKIRVKVVLPPGCVEVLESAILKTGEFNRADAVRVICEAYLGKKG